MNYKTMVLAASLWALCLGLECHAQQDRVGQQVMPRSGAKFTKGSIEIPESKLSLPLTVSKVENDLLWVGDAWVNSEQVVLLADAMMYYTDYLSDNPSSSWAYYNRGITRYKSSDYDNAIMDYSEAIRLDPVNALAYQKRGDSQLSKGELDNAINDYTIAIQHDANNAQAFNNRGASWTEKGESLKAIGDYTEAVRLAPNKATYHSNLGFLLATCTDSEHRDEEKALEHGTKACNLSEYKIPLFIDNLANTYALKGDFDEAIRLQKMAVDLCWNSGEFLQDYENRLKLYEERKPIR